MPVPSLVTMTPPNQIRPFRSRKMLNRYSLDPRPNLRGRVWGKTLPRSVLSAGMLLSVLMREGTLLQPTSVRVRLMTGSEYTVEHRNFENWSSAWPIALKIWKEEICWIFRNRGIPARHFRARLFPRPFFTGLGLGSRLTITCMQSKYQLWL